MKLPIFLSLVSIFLGVSLRAADFTEVTPVDVGLTPAFSEALRLANEPDFSNTLTLRFDLNKVGQKATPLGRLSLGIFEKVKLSRPGQKSTTARGALHAYVKNEKTGASVLVGSRHIKPASIPTLYTIDITDAVNEALAKPKGQRILNLEVKLTGTPQYYEVYEVHSDEFVLKIAPDTNWSDDWEKLLVPPFEGEVVYKETVLPLTDKPKEPLEVKLLYVPKRIIEVTNNANGEKLQEGRDWELRGGKLVFLPNSKAPIHDTEVFFLKEVKNKDTGEVKLQKSTVKLLEGGWYHQQQVDVTYEPATRDWKYPEKVSSLNQLPKTKALLESKKPFSMILFGDSISEGFNASAIDALWPYQLPYGDLVARQLRKVYGGEVTYMNHSRAGGTSLFAISQADSQVGWFRPDLVIIAFGMNDRSPKRINDVKKNVEEIIRIVRDRSPHTEFLIVTSMAQNPKQDVKVGTGPIENIRDQLLSVKGEGIAHVDITTTHIELAKRKEYLETSGNGINHPNDYLMRVYAQRILEVLAPGK